MASITLKNVSKTYPKNADASVKDFSLEVRDREFVIIVGPSGCGKSTTLRMIAGLEEITSGEIYIGDKRVNEIPAKDRNISMVFQNYALFPHLSVFDNIAFGLKVRKTPKSEITRKVNDAAKLLGLEALLTRKPKQLSGGERQRVAMGRAIVRDPAAFLMDEPLSNLDAKLRVQMRAELSKLRGRLQNTFVFVTHDQVEAMTLGDRIVVMDGGVIQQVGTPEEVYNSPANIFVAGFVGAPPMNFFAVKLDGKACTAGVRPEHIRLCDSSDQRRARVELTELLGSERLVHLDVAGDKFIMKAQADCGLQIGDEAAIRFEDGKVCLFGEDGRLEGFTTL